MNDPNERLGALISELRQLRGLTQSEFAKQLNTAKPETEGGASPTKLKGEGLSTQTSPGMKFKM